MHLDIDWPSWAKCSRSGPTKRPSGASRTTRTAPAALSADEADRLRLACQVAAELGVITWADIFEEEVAEALAEVDLERLREELLQVAAVAVAWVEAIDRRRAHEPRMGLLLRGAGRYSTVRGREFQLIGLVELPRWYEQAVAR
jgi:hypothetical protein